MPQQPALVIHEALSSNWEWAHGFGMLGMCSCIAGADEDIFNLTAGCGGMVCMRGLGVKCVESTQVLLLQQRLQLSIVIAITICAWHCMSQVSTWN